MPYDEAENASYVAERHHSNTNLPPCTCATDACPQREEADGGRGGAVQC
jgi:hypothetical protein